MGTIHQGQGHETSFRQIADREARPRSERHPLRRWRYRCRRVRHRHQRLALDRDRRHRVDLRGGQDHRQGIEARRASARSGRGRCAIRRWPLHHRRHRSRPHPQRGRARRVSAEQIAERHGAGLYETGTFSPPQDTFPNGCHLCEVEIDPDTGKVELMNYTVVDDVGTVINPKTAERPDPGRHRARRGPGADGAAWSTIRARASSSRPRSWITPCRAPTISVPMEIESAPVPTKLNPLGAKGAGEAGHGGRATGRDAGGARRAAAARRHRARHARNARARLAGDPGGEEVGVLYRVCVTPTGSLCSPTTRPTALRGWPLQSFFLPPPP